MFDVSCALDSLLAQQLPDGGWGYAPGQAMHLEPTCLALLALSAERDRHASAIERGLRAVAGCAVGDGTYRLARGREEAVWPTSLVLFTQSALGLAPEQTRKSVAALLGLRGRVPEGKEVAETQDIDSTIVGWPWADGNFSWAEPTAWACLALRKSGLAEHPRVVEGTRLLLDRTADDGGINYGNRRVLGRTTEPIPGPTALMLLALQGNDHPRVVCSVNYLLTHAPVGEDVEHLCWTRLALEEHRHLPGVPEAIADLTDRIRAAVEARAGTPWVRPNPLRLALAVLALTADCGSPFHVNGAPAKESPAPVPPSPRNPRIVDRVRSVFRGLAVTAITQLRQLPPETSVHIARAADYDGDLVGTLCRQFEAFRDQVPLKGKRVVLKPNLVEYHRDKVINTDPRFVSAVIEMCKREGAGEVIVAEGPGHWRNVEYLVSASGLGDVLRHHNVPFVDINHDEPVKLPNLGRLTGLDHLYLSQTVATADVLISLPKLKTHHWAGATLSMKNMFGTLPGICYGWPKNELHWRGIDNSIVDINLTRTPNLAIVDGIVGMEGDGPLNGTAKHLGAVVMGTDVLAVDATCCRLMRLCPERIGYLVLGSRKKLGILAAAGIRQIGESIEAVAQPFETVEHLRGLCVGRPA